MSQFSGNWWVSRATLFDFLHFKNFGNCFTAKRLSYSNICWLESPWIIVVYLGLSFIIYYCPPLRFLFPWTFIFFRNWNRQWGYQILILFLRLWFLEGGFLKIRCSVLGSLNFSIRIVFPSRCSINIGRSSRPKTPFS